jgi:hypothetical protein
LLSPPGQAARREEGHHEGEQRDQEAGAGHQQLHALAARDVERPLLFGVLEHQGHVAEEEHEVGHQIEHDRERQGDQEGHVATAAAVGQHDDGHGGQQELKDDQGYWNAVPVYLGHR